MSFVFFFFLSLSGHTSRHFPLVLICWPDFCGRWNGLFWQVSHMPDKQVTWLVVIYWRLAGQQPTDQVLEAPSVWKMPLQTRSANLKRASAGEFHWLKWSPRSFSQTRRVTLCSESAHLSAHFVPCHYQLGSLYKLSNSLAHSLLLLLLLLFTLSLCILLLLVQAHPASTPASTCRLCLFMAPQGIVIDLSLLLLWPVKRNYAPREESKQSLAPE